MDVFEYSARAYNFLVELVGLIVNSLFDPLRFSILAALVVGTGLIIAVVVVRWRSKS